MGVAIHDSSSDDLLVTVVGDERERHIVHNVIEKMGLRGQWLGSQVKSTAFFESNGGWDHDTGHTIQEFFRILSNHGVDAHRVWVSSTIRLMKVLGGAHVLNSSFHLAERNGDMAIGHTRLATESEIDLVHSQPLTTGNPQVAVVHNGHITNYWRWRRLLERRGHPFVSDNDSEVIAIYVSDRLRSGDSLQEALERVLVDLDGSYSVVALTDDAIGCVRDGLGLKPLMIAESDDVVLLASEAQAIRQLRFSHLSIHEAWPGEVRTWMKQPLTLWS